MDLGINVFIETGAPTLGGRGAATPPALSKDLIILVQKCLQCALNRNLVPPSLGAGRRACIERNGSILRKTRLIVSNKRSYGCVYT